MYIRFAFVSSMSKPGVSNPARRQRIMQRASVSTRLSVSLASSTSCRYAFLKRSFAIASRPPKRSAHTRASAPWFTSVQPAVMSSPGVDGPEAEEADEEADEAEAEEVVSSVRWRLLAGAADASLAELMARRKARCGVR